MLQPSSRLEWEYSCVCVCLCPAQKCAFLTKIYIKEKLPHNDNIHTHTAVGTQDIRFFFKEIFLLLLDTYYSAFDGVMTTTIASLLLSWILLIVKFSLSLFRQLPCSVSSYKIVLPIYRKNDLCLPCGIHSNTHTVCRSVDIAFGDQYTHRDRSTNTPYC